MKNCINPINERKKYMKIFHILLLSLLIAMVIYPESSYSQAPVTMTKDTTKKMDTTAMKMAMAPVTAPVTTPGPRKEDPSGLNTGNASDITAAKPGEPTSAELANQIGHNKVAINIIWTLITGFLVFFMQAGFAMVETGLTRAKNAAHTMAMNLFVYGLGVFGFWVCGFAFMFGGVGSLGTLGGFDGLNSEFTINLFGHTFGLLGTKGFFLSHVYDVGVFTLFLFQVVFMDTAATIPTGAMSERWKFISFTVYGVLVGAIIYPLFGNWVWGGGWLSQLGTNFHLGHGHVDFAGSSVVHMTGGVIALVGAYILGPRMGKYNKDKSPNAIPGHNIPMAVIGAIILAFGWFGFNPGSTLAGGDLRISVVAVNTLIASVTGAIAATLWMWIFRTKKPDPTMMINGLLAGLVAITAPCAFVSVQSAALIGVVAGFLAVEGAFFVERKLRVDDPVGAVAVHGINGAWGCLALGLFADGTYGDGWNGVTGTVKGLFYGDSSQFVAEIIGVVTNFIIIGLVSYIIFKLIGLAVGNRVSAKTEMIGLDVPEMGTEGYAGIKLDKNSETPLSR
jgi:Amt family ammonium transporter